MDYPYTSGTTMDTGSCEYDLASLNPVAAISGYDNLPVNDQDAIMNHIANVFNLCLNNLAKLESFQVGPLSISVAASNFKNYNGGIFTGKTDHWFYL